MNLGVPEKQAVSGRGGTSWREGSNRDGALEAESFGKKELKAADLSSNSLT